MAKTPASAPARPVAKPAPAQPERVRPRVTPAQFWKEVRGEARKITWPSWKETWITSVMVFIMVALTAAFFLVVDSGLSFFVQQLLKLAAA